MARSPQLTDDELGLFVLALVNHCVRAPLERFHGGPNSRISDPEMKDLMIEIVNKVFTVLHDETFVGMIMANPPRHWDAPTVDHSFMEWKRLREALSRRRAAAAAPAIACGAAPSRRKPG